MQLWGSLSILWHCVYLGLEGKLTFSSPVAIAEFSKFAGILNAEHSRHHFFFRIWNSSAGIPSFPVALFIVMLPKAHWLHTPGCPALCEWSHHCGYLSHEDLFCIVLLCILSTSADTAAAAKSLQSCLILCDPIDSSPRGSPVPGILQARTLEWIAISFSNAWKWKVKVNSLSRVRLLATPWTAAHQAPLSIGFSRQECWSGVPLPSPSTSS